MNSIVLGSPLKEFVCQTLSTTWPLEAGEVQLKILEDPELLNSSCYEEIEILTDGGRYFLNSTRSQSLETEVIFEYYVLKVLEGSLTIPTPELEDDAVVPILKGQVTFRKGIVL